MTAARVALALAVLTALPLASASLPYSLAPLAATNVLVNGGFENGLAGWALFSAAPTPYPPYPTVVAGGADGTANAVLIRNVVQTSSVLLQRFSGLEGATLIALDFHAKVELQRNTEAVQGLAIYHNFNQAGAKYLGGLGFGGVQPRFFFGAYGASTAVEFPQDGAMHQYTLLLSPLLGLTVASIDGIPVGYTLGAADATSWNSLYFGDGYGGDVESGKGAASDVRWDEFYLERLA